MKTQACAPCAKRKVRCDREEPSCSNCKRRKQDHCSYPELTPAERIKELESLVATLKENQEPSVDETKAEAAISPKGAQKRPASPLGASVNESAILQEGGESVYIESTFQTWDQRYGHVQVGEGRESPATRAQHRSCDALGFMMYRGRYEDLLQRYPSPSHAAVLWTTFDRCVKPVFKVCFDQELAHLQSATTLQVERSTLSTAEHVLIFSIYLISIVSLTEEECLNNFGESKPTLLSEYQTLCDIALAQTGFPNNADIVILQALTYLMGAGLERQNTRSLWALMGLVIRNAERLGFHRDGTLLKLSPFETERRRRTWWQLQQIDLALSVRAGATSLTMLADWDTKLPLNIEDEDVSPDATTTPKEREGLTEISYSLWLYYVINEQRSLRRPDGSRVGLTWIVGKTMDREAKDEFLNRLERGMNDRFLKYCDPLRAIDMLLQLSIRGTVCGLRRFVTRAYTLQDNSPSQKAKDDSAFLDVSIRSVEYDIAYHSNKAVQRFGWRQESIFPWSALVRIIMEVGRQRDSPKADKLWQLLTDLYDANTKLLDFASDSRKSYAAELIVTVWKERENYVHSGAAQPGSRLIPLQKPQFVTALEERLQTGRTGIPHLKDNVRSQHDHPLPSPAETPEMGYFDNFDIFSDAAMANIDWAFWDSLV